MSQKAHIADPKASSWPPRRQTGLIFDIKKYAIHDGPGIRTTIFFKGCPLSCRWCHNPESWRGKPELGIRASRCLRCGRCVEACKSGAISMTEQGPATDETTCRLCGECVDVCISGAREMIGRRMSVGEVMSEIRKDVVFYDQSGGGATFSGGEPLMQPEFLLALLDACRRQEIHTAVDTTCHAEPEIIEKVAETTDLFLCDLKHINNDLHREFTGADNHLILKNIRSLSGAGKQIIIRIPIVPGFNEDPAAVELAGEFIASLPSVDGVEILPYNGGGPAKSTRLTGKFALMQSSVPDNEEMAAIADRLGRYGLEVKIGG